MFNINRHINNRKQIVSEIKEINYDGLKWIDIIKPKDTDIEMLRKLSPCYQATKASYSHFGESYKKIYPQRYENIF